VGGTPEQMMVWKTVEDKVWRCNQSGFEYCLEKIGSYDWYLDIYFPPWTSAAGAPIILATWRRMWKYSYGIPYKAVSYTAKNPDTGEVETLPLIWPQEKGPPPFQELCYEAIDVDPAYNYDFWRDPGNVYKAYRQAVNRLTDADRKTVKQRHYHWSFGDIKDYQIQHQLVQDMYDALLMYKYLNMVSTGFAGYAGDGGYAADKSSFAAAKGEVALEWATAAENNPFPTGGGAGVGGAGNADDTEHLTYNIWKATCTRAGPVITVSSTKEILDSLGEEPALTVYLGWIGEDYGDPPPVDTEDSPPDPCGVGVIGNIIFSHYDRSTLKLEGGDVDADYFPDHNNLVCDCFAPQLYGFVRLPISDRTGDTTIRFTALPIIGDVLSHFNSAEGRPRLPGDPPSFCPPAQVGWLRYLDIAAGVVVNWYDDTGAITINPIQPLGCIPLE